MTATIIGNDLGDAPAPEGTTRRQAMLSFTPLQETNPRILGDAIIKENHNRSD